MARLQCDARNCVHNKEHFCCISSICVDGKQAMRDAETCCADFREKKEAVSNSACGCEEKNPVVDIHCKAQNCIYNDQCHCEAEHVCICGPHACECHDTRCETFKIK